MLLGDLYSKNILRRGFMGNCCDYLTGEIDELMEEYLKDGNLNGSILVSQGRNVLYKRGLGYANMEWKIPNEPDTRHSAGSLIDQFTSMLILQLVEAGKISLDGYITDYLDYYRSDTGKLISIYNLLTCTSGIPDYTEKPGFIENKIHQAEYTVKNFITDYCSDDLKFEPGTKFTYSNSDYCILGAIIEKVAGKSFGEVLKENILIPLNMTNSGYDDDDYAIVEKHSSTYEKTIKGYKRANCWDRNTVYASGSMYSTVEDLFLWDQALYTDKLLSEKYQDIMFKPFINNYACGWSVANAPLCDLCNFLSNPYDFVSHSDDELKNIVTTAYHTGNIFGMHIIVLRIIDKKQSIIFMGNTGITPFNSAIREIIKILNCPPLAHA